MHLFSGNWPTGEVLKIAFNIDLEFEFHYLLAFIVIVLISVPLRALRLDIQSREFPGGTYSMGENETWASSSFVPIACSAFESAVSPEGKCHFFPESDSPLQG